MNSVLVLNAADKPINIYRTYKPAVLKLGKKTADGQPIAELVAAYTDSKLRSWKQAMDAPAIIKLLYFMNPPHKVSRKVPYSRKNIWLRDKCTCSYCGVKVSLDDFELEHVIPKDQGGKAGWMNICTACTVCNRKKANRTPEQAGMRLRHRLFEPRFTVSREKEMLERLKSLKNFPHESWRQFVYYDIPLDQDA